MVDITLLVIAHAAEAEGGDDLEEGGDSHQPDDVWSDKDKFIKKDAQERGEHSAQAGQADVSAHVE